MTLHPITRTLADCQQERHRLSEEVERLRAEVARLTHDLTDAHVTAYTHGYDDGLDRVYRLEERYPEGRS